jgi:hypothetical protein
MNNLYVSARKEQPIFQPEAVSSYTVYLEQLKVENPDAKLEIALITPLMYKGAVLYVLSTNGTFYLSDKYEYGQGIENILYSSKKLKRVLNYGATYLEHHVDKEFVM